MPHDDDQLRPYLDDLLRRTEQRPQREFVQFSFECPRELRDRVKILCIERKIAQRDFAVAAIRYMVSQYEHERDAE